MNTLEHIYQVLLGNQPLFTVPGTEIGIPLLVLILIPVGIYFTVRTKFLPIRMFPEMIRISVEKNEEKKGGISGWQALIVSTATRVGTGNMAGVVAAVSLGGAGAVFWMWVTALIGSATAYIEGTLAYIHNEDDPLYGGKRGGPAYYLHKLFKGKKKKSILAVIFAASGLLCWCAVGQIAGNSVTESVQNAFQISPWITSAVLTGLAAVIVLRKNATVKVLDILVPIMAVLYFVITLIVMAVNIGQLPSVFARIFEEAFGLRQVAAGGFGAALMFGVKRGLFSNEAGSGSAPCAAAAGEVSHPAKAGLFQAFGVIIDTIVICSCTAMIVLLAPESVLAGQEGMALLQSAMYYHLGGYIGVVFTAVVLFLFCFSTFIGILFYARSNVAYLFGDNWWSQTAFKIFALIMLFIGGISQPSFVWDMGDLGIALTTIINMMAILPMGGQSINALKDYNALKKAKK